MSDRLVLVQWDDAIAHEYTGWRHRSETSVLEPASAISVGWVISDTPKAIVLVSHRCDEDVDGEICIPRGCITNIVDLIEAPV
jgi:hypothetical protein